MNVLHSFLRGLSTGTGIIAAVGIAAVVLAAGGGVLLATQSGGNQTKPDVEFVYLSGITAWIDPTNVEQALGILNCDDPALIGAVPWYNFRTNDLPVQWERFSYSVNPCYSGTDTRQSLSTSADLLQDKLLAEFKFGIQKFVLVSHSLGGAVIAEWSSKTYKPDIRPFVLAVVEFNAPLFTANQNCRATLGAESGFGGQAAKDLLAKDRGDTVRTNLSSLLLGNGYDRVVPASCSNVSKVADTSYVDKGTFENDPGCAAPYDFTAAWGDDFSCVWNVPGAGLDHHGDTLGFQDARDAAAAFIRHRLTVPPTASTGQSIPANGSVVQQAEPGDQRPIYLIEGGQKRKADLAVVQSCGWLDRLTTAPRATLDAIPNGPDVPPCTSPPPPRTERYCISGLVLRADNNSPISAVVSVTGPSNRNAATDASGGYSVCDLAPGSYVVTPNATGFSFAPPSLPVQITSTNVSGVKFSGSASVKGCIRGQVTTPAGASEPLAGAVLKLSDGRTALSEARGEYSFCGTRPGSYRITGSLAGASSFSPPFKDVTVPDSGDVVGNNFIAVLDRPFCVSGQLTQSAGPSQPIGGIPVLIDGIVQATSGTDGRYSKCELAQGTHSVAPAHPDWVFGPESRAVSGPPDQFAGFTGSLVKRFCIGGYATGSQGPSTPFRSVSVQLSGPDTSSTVTGVDGSYIACGLREGRYNVVINAGPDVGCNPNPRPVFLSGGDSLSEGFTCTSIVRPKCPSPPGPLFPADGAHVAPGQAVTLQWPPGPPGCRYAVTLLEGCKGSPVPLLDTPSWSVGALPTGSRCGWFVQGVDLNNAFDSPVADWWVYWGFETPTSPPPRAAPTTVTAVPTTVTAVPTTVTAVPTTTTPQPPAPLISRLGCVGPGTSGLDGVELADWGQLFNCNPTVTGFVTSWSWTATGGSPSSGTSNTFSTSFSTTGTNTIRLTVCNATGCASGTQLVRTPNCDITPDPIVTPYIRMVSPLPCGQTLPGQPVTLQWEVVWGSTAPTPLTFTVHVTECTYADPLGSTDQHEMTLQAFPAGTWCNWWVSAPGVMQTNQARFIFR